MQSAGCFSSARVLLALLRLAHRLRVVAGQEDPIQLCVKEQLPGKDWPAATAEASQQAWPFGAQPSGLQCLPEEPDGHLGQCGRDIQVWKLKEFNGVIINPLRLSPYSHASASESACKQHAYAMPLIEYWQWRPDAGGCYTNEAEKIEYGLVPKDFPYPLLSSDLTKASNDKVVGEFIQHYCPFDDTAVPVVPADQIHYLSESEVELADGEQIEVHGSLAATLRAWDVSLGEKVSRHQAIADVTFGNTLMRVFAPTDGWLVDIKVRAGAVFAMADVIGTMDTTKDSTQTSATLFFKHYRVKLDDKISKGEVVAVAENGEGKQVDIKADASGHVKDLLPISDGEVVRHGEKIINFEGSFDSPSMDGETSSTAVTASTQATAAATTQSIKEAEAKQSVGSTSSTSTSLPQSTERSNTSEPEGSSNPSSATSVTSTAAPVSCPPLKSDIEHTVVTPEVEDVLTFKRFHVVEHDCVEEGQVLATGTTADGEEVDIKAPEKGCVEALNNLTANSVISKECDLASLRVELPEGVEAVGFNISEPVIFLEFVVKEGDFVEENATMARFSPLSGTDQSLTERRLRSLSSVGSLLAPFSARILEEGDLQKGSTVSPGQPVMFIERADSRKEYEVHVLYCIILIQLLLCCCIFCLICKCTAEPKPTYQPVLEGEDTDSSMRDRVLKIKFADAAGTKYEKMFKYRPLGLEYTREAPIRVARFKEPSQARRLGVQVGWKIVGVDKRDVSEDFSFHRVDQLILDGLDGLPPLPVELQFACPDGSTRSLDIKRRVLGINWNGGGPSGTVGGVREFSQAEGLGIETGWKLTHIGEEPLAQDVDGDTLRGMLSARLEHLPG